MLLVLGSAVLFAVNGTASKLVLRAGLDSPQLTSLRAGGAFLGLTVLCVAVPPGPSRLRIRRAELPTVLWYGLTGCFLVPMLYFVAISRLPVGIGLLLEYLSPLLVALWARYGEHQRVRARLWFGLVLALAGVAGVTEVWGGAHLDGLGVAAGLGAAGLLGFYYVLGSRSMARRDALSLTWWGYLAAAAAGTLVHPWWTFPWHVLLRRGDGVPVWLLAGYVVCFGSIAAFLLVAGGLRHLPATSVGLVGMMEVVIATAVAWLVLGESLRAVQLVSGVVMLAGIAVAETARVETPPAATVPPSGAPAGEPVPVEPLVHRPADQA